ncbi:MAG: adenylate/guanylate cyclase [Chloroflexi bacterium]|nr:adenylate/guanylate cyclase [Chloroflexota bacterium]
MNDHPPRILIVDDQPSNVMLAQAILKPLGCDIETASDGMACLRAVERTPPDLILLDVMMPEMDGFTACQCLKEHPDFMHIPVVLLTALASSEDRVAGIEAGADDFVSKPFEPHELRARVKSLLRVKRLVEVERLHLRQTLERYVDSSVADMLIAREDLALPGGVRTDASVLFSDIRGFSTWSETLAPEVVVEVVNLFLTRAVDAVFKYGGTVDKFTGDGLMAIFGAPVQHRGHASRAVCAAVEIVRAAESVVHPSLSTPLSVGCGVNSGEMVVGNVGSERRMDYTALGDAVNVASRLCQEARGGCVIVSASTYGRLKHADAEEVGFIHLKNRQESVQIYSISSVRRSSEDHERTAKGPPSLIEADTGKLIHWPRRTLAS